MVRFEEVVLDLVRVETLDLEFKSKFQENILKVFRVNQSYHPLGLG